MAVTIPAQDSILPGKKDSATNVITSADSLMKKQQDEISENTLKQNEQNLNSFMKEIKERQRKEKQQMYLRLGLGLLFLVVLIIGLLRRRKRKAA